MLRFDEVRDLYNIETSTETPAPLALPPIVQAMKIPSVATMSNVHSVFGFSPHEKLLSIDDQLQLMMMKFANERNRQNRKEAAVGTTIKNEELARMVEADNLRIEAERKLEREEEHRKANEWFSAFDASPEPETKSETESETETESESETKLETESETETEEPAIVLSPPSCVEPPCLPKVPTENEILKLIPIKKPIKKVTTIKSVAAAPVLNVVELVEVTPPAPAIVSDKKLIRKPSTIKIAKTEPTPSVAKEDTKPEKKIRKEKEIEKQIVDATSKGFIDELYDRVMDIYNNEKDIADVINEYKRADFLIQSFLYKADSPNDTLCSLLETYKEWTRGIISTCELFELSSEFIENM